MKVFFLLLFISIFSFVRAQDNSPYSRFGIGDLMPGTNISTRGMGSISAAHRDFNSINFNNPASYSGFFTKQEAKTKKMEYGSVILDVGINLTNRTLIAPNTPNRFTSSDFLFSYLQVGLPLRKNWGLSFGIRPISRISYLITRNERLFDPVTTLPIDSANTRFRGSGGSYLPSIGTGFGFDLATKESTRFRTTNNLSLGVNAGYMFGSREATTLRNLINDTVLYYASNHTHKTSFGDLFYNAGLQYQVERVNKIKKTNTVFRFGISGNWEQKLTGSKDDIIQTYTLGAAGEELEIDSVFEQKDVKGQVIYPSNYKAGFAVQKTNENMSGWMFGVDYSAGQWSNYRYFGLKDSVQDNWQINVGAQFFPRPRSNYFSRVAYRFGVYAGPDYIKVDDNLPAFGVSFGMGLPIANYNRLTNQSTIINLAFEYGKRGNNDNLLKENLFRFSLGFNFNDIWFRKRKYE